MPIDPIGDISPFEAFSSIREAGRLPFLLYRWYGRYSFAGAGPLLTITAVDGETLIDDNSRMERSADPFSAVSDALSSLRVDGLPSPFPFRGGAVGYFGYGLKDFSEPPREVRPSRARLGLPDCLVGLYDTVYVYDHLTSEAFIVSAPGAETRRVRSAILDGSGRKPLGPIARSTGFESNMTRAGYVSMIRRAKEYIESGDIYQINLSQRLSIDWEGDAFSLFASMCGANPAPFSAFMDCGDFSLISNSPERLLKVEGSVAETSPIKGTRPRGENPEEDGRLIAELRASKKERAEHVMIVDLERNDIGRISVPGSVQVTEFERIETYPHLHHMVSTIRGRLLEGTGPVEALKALFPGGSVTGAPKIRAMEIIEELETAPREVYTGGIGWIGLGGNMDISMAIRTAVYRDKRLCLHVGAGIVADSDPETEYDETMLKATDFLKGVGIL